MASQASTPRSPGQLVRFVQHVKHYRKKIAFIILALAPALLWHIFFVTYPLFAALLKSFYNWNLVSHTDTFIGVDNYVRLWRDPVMWISFKNTVLAVVYTTPPVVILALFTALMLNKLRHRLRTFFTTIYFLPVMTSIVAAVAMWKWVYHPFYGILNYVLEFIGIPPQSWLRDPVLALISVSVVVIWQSVGYNTVIFLAALQSIPQTFYDAAKVDGAVGFSTFRYITLPLLMPAALFTTVLSVIGAFQIFGPVEVMTRGGPGNATRVLALYVFDKGVGHLEMGYASAIAWVLFAVIMFFTVLQFKVFRADWEY